MKLEQRIARFVVETSHRTASAEARLAVRRIAMAAMGTAIAGAGEDGIAALRGLLRERGGTGQARSLVFGDRLPATAAARLNGTMSRALDWCDAMAPGIHTGASLLPAALAAAELAGGCDGDTFFSALLAGAELGARFNLSEAQYDGFDPTGVAIVFASTAAAARVLRLDARQTLNALGLAFNRCGGSFQSNVDGTLAVRMIQGWVAETGVDCAQMARAGITGPANFLSGHYGFAHLYGRDTLEAAAVAADLDTRWRVEATMFKKYPSCGATQGLTELVLELVGALRLRADDVREVEVRLNPYCHRLVGHPFRLGENPRVDAQFSVQYCVANAIVRGASRLDHFRPEAIVDPAVQALVPRVRAVGDPALDARGHTAVDVTLVTAEGAVHRRTLDVAPGYPGNGLTDAQHLQRVRDCLDYAPRPPSAAQAEALLADLAALESVPDARRLIDHTLAPQPVAAAA